MKTAIDSTIDSSVEIGFRAAVGATAPSRLGEIRQHHLLRVALAEGAAGGPRRSAPAPCRAASAANSSATSIPATTFPSHPAWRRHASLDRVLELMKAGREVLALGPHPGSGGAGQIPGSLPPPFARLAFTRRSSPSREAAPKQEQRWTVVSSRTPRSWLRRLTKDWIIWLYELMMRRFNRDGKHRVLLILIRTVKRPALSGAAAADRFGGHLLATLEGVGSAGEGEETGGELLRHRARGAEVAAPSTVLVEAARDADLEVGDVRPGTGGAADQRDEHRAKGALAAMDAEGNDEGDRGLVA